MLPQQHLKASGVTLTKRPLVFLLLMTAAPYEPVILVHYGPVMHES